MFREGRKLFRTQFIDLMGSALRQVAVSYDEISDPGSSLRLGTDCPDRSFRTYSQTLFENTWIYVGRLQNS